MKAWYVNERNYYSFGYCFDNNDYDCPSKIYFRNKVRAESTSQAYEIQTFFGKVLDKHSQFIS